MLLPLKQSRLIPESESGSHSLDTGEREREARNLLSLSGALHTGRSSLCVRDHRIRVLEEGDTPPTLATWDSVLAHGSSPPQRTTHRKRCEGTSPKAAGDCSRYVIVTPHSIHRTQSRSTKSLGQTIASGIAHCRKEHHTAG